jgi:MFS family permease
MSVLLLGRVLQGLGLGSFSTALTVLIAELAPASRRGAALGLTGASMSVAFISAPLVGDWLATHWGYTAVFNASAATGAISVVLVALLGVTTRQRVASSFMAGARQSETLRSPSDPDDSQRVVESGLRFALAQPGVRAGMLTMAALGIPFGAFITFLPLLTEERGVVGAGLVYSVYAATVFLAQPLSGWLTDRIGRHRMILPGLLITGLAAGMLSLGGSLAVFALAGSIFGLGGGLVRGGVDPLVQDSVPTALRGRAAAVQYTSFDLWIGGGSYLIGVLATALGYATTFAVTGVICVLGAAGLVIMLRKANHERHSTEPRVPNSHE